MDKPEVIAIRLNSLREALGFKQARAFCQFVGITDQAWNHYSSSRRRISLDEAMKIVNKTGVSLDWIYRGIEHILPVHLVEKLRAVRFS
ncbi:helix-turn-helix domain-containing protein [Microvirga rosea]|uniref:helix-turn-helix domain-containing protein n=1 Tax=Microvirga rosea TaxID=2715425 RepID=UPI001D0B5220|nr:helix-turn-helix transcriptional regulator [Microvirga rosea]MCB8819550.1 helix-turn-helix domain-containing protein [Microvirga rosea]